MRRAQGPRRRLPVAVKFMLILLALAALAYPFRLPPASRADSNSFYMTDGSDTARMLREAAGELRCDIAGTGGVLHVDARVEVPEAEHVPVLRVRQGGLDEQRAMAALGMAVDTAEVAEVNRDVYAYMGYDAEFELLWCDNGALEIGETGRVMAYLYEPGRVYGAEEIAAMLHEGGLLAGEAQLAVLDEGRTVLVRPMYNGIPVSNTFAFDSYTGYPNYGAAFVVEQRMDGMQLSVEGRALGAAEVVWESARVISPEDALRALAERCTADEYVERMVLAYHVRTIYADPFNVLLYPVWEIYCKSSGEMSASIVNAITGQVELSLLGAQD